MVTPNIYWIRRKQIIFFSSSKPFECMLKILIKFSIFNLRKFLKTLAAADQDLKDGYKKKNHNFHSKKPHKAESLNDSTALHHHLQRQEIKELKLKLTGRAKHSAACSTLFSQFHCLWTHEACSPFIYRFVAGSQTGSLKLLWCCRPQNAEVCKQNRWWGWLPGAAWQLRQSSAQAEQRKLAAIKLLATAAGLSLCPCCSGFWAIFSMSCKWDMQKLSVIH